RQTGTARTLSDDVELAILDWTLALRSHGVRVSAKMLELEALSIEKLYDVPRSIFAASPTWMASFLSRYRFTLRTKTRQGQVSAAKVLNDAVSRVTRSAAGDTSGGTANQAGRDVANTVREVDPRNYGEAMKSSMRKKWIDAMKAEIAALEANDVWTFERRTPKRHVLHAKWVFKTKMTADGEIERYKARLLACGILWCGLYHYFRGGDGIRDRQGCASSRTTLEGAC
ncbi:Copia protein, partial [Phytophthora megakarya]